MTTDNQYPAPDGGDDKRYRIVYNALLERIVSGKYPNGSKLPTQYELCRELNVSRATIIHALNDLRIHGYVRSLQGSGCYVRLSAASDVRIGLIIPGNISYHERDSVFLSIQHQIMGAASRLGWQLVLGDSAIHNKKDAATWQPVELARQMIKGGVQRVIFVPHEVRGQGEAFNNNVLAELAEAKIPVVLLDRDVVSYPQRSSYDLVCMDNIYAGQILGKHLLAVGSQRVVFVRQDMKFPTPSIRLEGLRLALRKGGHDLPDGNVVNTPGENLSQLRSVIRKVKPDTIVGDNDYSSALIMKELLSMGYGIPADMKVASFDNAPIANLLPVGLTSVAQPVEALAFKAIETLRDRSEFPDMLPVTVQVQCKLIVRQSTSGKELKGRKGRLARGG